MLADAGHDLVLDLVLFERASFAAWCDALHGHPTWLVGVGCDAATLAARERGRGDRLANLALSQLPAVHAHADCYDLEVDTTGATPADLAETIAARALSGPAPEGLARLRDALW